MQPDDNHNFTRAYRKFVRIWALQIAQWVLWKPTIALLGTKQHLVSYGKKVKISVDHEWLDQNLRSCPIDGQLFHISYLELKSP